MSYNNNFSYFNAPASSNEWWGSKDSKKTSSFDESRVVKIDYNNQPYAQNYMQNYAQSMILPSENRAVEQIHPRHEVLQGTVTQLFSSFGYINDDIIFSKTDVSGPMVKVGDRVAVDATYQPNNPTKYKGERVCKIDDTRFSSASSGLSKMKPLSRDLSSRIDIPLPTYRQETGKYDAKLDKKTDKKYEKMESPRRSSAPKEMKLSDSKRYSKGFGPANSSVDLTRQETGARKTTTTSRKDDSVRQSLKRKTRSSSKNHKSASKSATDSEKVPSKIAIEKAAIRQTEAFSLRELDCASLKFRCKNLEPPSQFFHASLKYQQTFPLNHPMKLGNACPFKVLCKRVRSIDNYICDQLNRDIDPADADSTFCAKVMLLSTSELADFYKQVLVLAEEFDGTNKLPITKAIKFLVGGLGPNKEFAFGGAWSPSLDGPDPDNNPRVLINTAIRTCKNLTGIDLSGCSSWPKFLELHYYRPLQKVQKKTVASDTASVNGKTEPEVVEPEERFEYIEPRMETVVYYVPDIWNCVPTQESWNDIKRMYQEQLTSLMCPPPPSIPLPTKQPVVPTTTNGVQDEGPAVKKSASISSSGDSQEEEDYNFNENEEIDEKPKDSDEPITYEQPTHYSGLNVDGMKIVEIKKELQLRKLSVKGVMDQLKARLKSNLEKEEADEKSKPDYQVPVKPVVNAAAKPTTETVLSEAEKKELKQLYTLPDTPHIIAHHNLKYQDNKMRIKTMSLHSLLSYYDMKLDEATFEVALFAKQFLEMMRRDAVFNLYKSLVVSSEADLVVKDEANPAKKPKVMVTTSKRTINRPLLFSCTILDREKSNKIPLEELKGMIEGLGICLSSEQLSALLNKIKDPSKSLQYRVLTDKEIDDNDITNMLTVGQTDDLDYIRELAMGNKALFEDEGGANMDTSCMDYEEVDRLKNELDKSERCRQTLELRFSEIRDEAERGRNLLQVQIKETEKLREQIADYRSKYHNEQDRGDYYKKDLDKLYRDLKDMDKLTASLGKCVNESLERFKKTSDKTAAMAAATSATSTVSSGTGKAKPEPKQKLKEDKVSSSSGSGSSKLSMGSSSSSGGNTSHEQQQQHNQQDHHHGNGGGDNSISNSCQLQSNNSNNSTSNSTSSTSNNQSLSSSADNNADACDDQSADNGLAGAATTADVVGVADSVTGGDDDALDSAAAAPMIIGDDEDELEDEEEENEEEEEEEDKADDEDEHHDDGDNCATDGGASSDEKMHHDGDADADGMHGHEDFELSRPSDYEIIILDEAE